MTEKRTATRWVTRKEFYHCFPNRPERDGEHGGWVAEGGAIFVAKESFPLCELFGVSLEPGDCIKLTITQEPVEVPPTNEELAAELRKLDKDLATSNERHRVVQAAADRLEKLGESNGKG